MNYIHYIGSGIYRERSNCFQPEDVEAKGGEDVKTTSIFTKVFGNGIGSVFRQVTNIEDEFVMVKTPKRVKKPQTRKSVCDRLDRFIMGPLSHLTIYADLVDAFLERRDRDNGKLSLEEEIFQQENVIMTLEREKADLVRSGCNEEESNEWKDEVNNLQEKIAPIKERLDLDLELQRKTNPRFLLSQTTLLKDEQKKALKKFDRLTNIDQSLYSKKYSKKVEEIQSALFNFLISLMKLGATRCENYRKGKNYLHFFMMKTLEVEVFVRNLPKITEDQILTLDALSEVFRDIVRKTPQKYK
jgi:hypothetical protein